MSYDIELIDPETKEPVEPDEPHHMRGGTYAMGGTTRAHFERNLQLRRDLPPCLGR